VSKNSISATKPSTETTTQGTEHLAGSLCEKEAEKDPEADSLRGENGLREGYRFMREPT
jgi:hypothetical protein